LVAKIEVISRDRASAYAHAAHEAAPQATQLADRFHLLMNLREAVERSLGRQLPAIRAAVAEAPDLDPRPVAEADTAPTPAPPLTARQQARAGKRQRQRERFERVQQLHRDGYLSAASPARCG
jgi:transposase